MRSILEAMEGPGRRRWYVAEVKPDPVLLLGPVPTRREARQRAWQLARERAGGGSYPWPQMDTFEGYPGFAALLFDTGVVMYVGRLSAMCDQGPAWATAVRRYEEGSSASMSNR